MTTEAKLADKKQDSNLAELYFLKTVRGMHYRRTPPGTLYFNRMVARKPCFGRWSVVKKPHPKTLILADWRARSWREADSIAIQTMLKTRLQEGFDIYLPDAGRFIKLTTTNLDSLSEYAVKKAITWAGASPNLAVHAAKQLRLSTDAIHVLDAYHLDKLLPGGNACVEKTDIDAWFAGLSTHFLESRRDALLGIVRQHLAQSDHHLPTDTVSATSTELPTTIEDTLPAAPVASVSCHTDETTHLTSTPRAIPKRVGQAISLSSYIAVAPELRLRLRALWTKANPPVMTILHDIGGNTRNGLYLPELTSLGKHIEVKDSCPHLILGPTTIENLLRENSLSYETRCLTLDSLTSVDKLCVTPHDGEAGIESKELTFSKLVELLRYMPYLKILDLMQVLAPTPKELAELANSELTLDYLEILELKGDCEDFRAHGLPWLSTHAPAMRCLRLYDVSPINDGFLFGCFPKLTQLGLYQCRIHWSGLQALEQSLPDLKELNLLGCVLMDEADTELPPLTWLSKLDALSYSHPDSGALMPVLAQAFNLKKLNISNLKVMIDEPLSIPVLAQLGILCINSVTMDWSRLQSWIAHMPVLHTLDLSALILMGAPPSIPWILPRLEKLMLQSTDVSSQTVSVLLAQAPRLKELHISSTLLNTEVNLPQLEVLHINGSFDVSLLERFLQRHPKLTTLYITAPGYSSDVLPTTVFPQLRVFKWTGPPRKAAARQTFSMQVVPHLVETYPGSGDYHDPVWVDKVDVSQVPIPTGPMASSSSSASQTAANDSQWLDARTQYNPSAKHDVKRIFYALDGDKHPDVNDYRLHVYNRSVINPEPCNVNTAFWLEKHGDLQLKPCLANQSSVDVIELAKLKSLKSTDERLYYGKHTFELTQQWQPVPSLSAHEHLSDYHVDPEGAVELSYSARDNQYYIRSKHSNPQTVTLDWLVRVPNMPSLAVLPQDVQDLIREIAQPGHDPRRDKPLKLNTERPTGYDYLQSLKQNPQGACRHKAFLFQQLMQEQRPDIPVRIVNNISHSYAEVYYQGQWISCSVGGHPANVSIDEPFKKEIRQAASNSSAHTLPTQTKAHTMLQAYFIKKLRKRIQTQSRPLASIADACDRLLSKQPQRKMLLTVTDTESVEVMIHALEARAKEQRYHVFYVHSPDDLLCQIDTLRAYGSQCVVDKAPSGRLYDFLQKAKIYAPRRFKIIINYDNFNKDDFAKFHALLEKKHPKVDGVDLPRNVDIIGLINTNKPDYYRGEDFWGRFDKLLVGNDLAQEASSWLPDIPVSPVPNDATEHPVINLYQGLDWYEQLIGAYQLREGKLHFYKGALADALFTAMMQDTPIEIQNAPWDNPDFIQFWRQAYQRGYIETPQGHLPFAQDLKLWRRDGYDWDTLTAGVTWSSALPSPDAKVLNEQTIGEFLARYDAMPDTEVLVVQAGWIDSVAPTDPSFAPTALPIFITQTIEAADLARLLTLCRDKRVVPQFFLAPGVLLPEPLSEKMTPSAHLNPPWQGVIPSLPTHVIASNDPAAMTAWVSGIVWQDLPREQVVVIDVTGCSVDDLWLYQEPDVVGKHYYLRKTERALLRALHADKRVILTGQFSEELVNGLAPYLLARQYALAPKGQLLLLPQHADVFNYLPVETQSMTPDMTFAALATCFTPAQIDQLHENKVLDSDSLTNLSFESLRTRATNHLIDPNGAYDGQQGFAEPIAQQPLAPLDFATSAADAQAFIAERRAAINNILAYAPYVFLTGPTGAGKTGFVQRYIQDETTLLFEGETAIAAWASAPRSDQRKILFLDEANLHENTWEMFQGLFHNPPGILWKGTYYPLSDEHKVIFAGNPQSYGDERELSPFFMNHGFSHVLHP